MSSQERKQLHLKIYKQISSETGDNFLCLTCGYTNKWKNSMRDHVLTTHEGFIFNCKLCDYQSYSKSNLQNHSRYNHLEKHSCPQCDYKSVSPTAIKEHIKTIHEGIKYSCPHCDNKYNRNCILNDHIKVVHEGKMLQCSFCSFAATKVHSLTKHMSKYHEFMNSWVYVIQKYFSFCVDSIFFCFLWNKSSEILLKLTVIKRWSTYF